MALSVEALDSEEVLALSTMGVWLGSVAKR
jgi:hypothetical protein